MEKTLFITVKKDNRFIEVPLVNTLTNDIDFYNKCKEKITTPCLPLKSTDDPYTMKLNPKNSYYQFIDLESKTIPLQKVISTSMFEQIKNIRLKVFVYGTIEQIEELYKSNQFQFFKF